LGLGSSSARHSMTNYKEEQELELEALESIFEEGKELEKISPTEFLLKFKPFPQDEEENFVGVILRVAYTDEYPETAPEWELKEMWENAISDDKLAELKGKVEEAIESSLGMAMVYTIAEMLQDWLKENNVKALSMHEEMMKRMGGDEAEEEDDPDNEAEVDKLEEEEWKGLKEKPMCAVGDRITMDNFLEWKKRFDDEMVANGTLRREDNKAKTGKAIFLEAQASGECGKGKDAKEGEMVYNAALFGEEDNDDDLDDLDDDDSEEEKDKAGYP